MPLIVARGISKRFAKSLALTNVSFTIHAGEFIALVGPSGCGKSTLLRILAGLDHQTEGTLQTERRHEAREAFFGQIGFVFQAATLMPWQSALRNVCLPLELAGWSLSDARVAAAEALDRVKLATADHHKLPHGLSGGMQMRVSIARALVTQPRLLLLDEPFAALDDGLRSELGEDLLEQWRELRFTTILVTHNIAEAVYLSQRVLLLGGSPGTLIDEVPISLPQPRERSLHADPEFGRLVTHILQNFSTRETA